MIVSETLRYAQGDIVYNFFSALRWFRYVLRLRYASLRTTQPPIKCFARFAVQFHHAAVFDRERTDQIVGQVHGNEAKFGRFINETVEIDRAPVERGETPRTARLVLIAGSMELHVTPPRSVRRLEQRRNLFADDHRRNVGVGTRHDRHN